MQPLCTINLVKFIRVHHSGWLVKYYSTKKSEESAYGALVRLLQRFADRHGFSTRLPSANTVLYSNVKFQNSVYHWSWLYSTVLILIFSKFHLDFP